MVEKKEHIDNDKKKQDVKNRYRKEIDHLKKEIENKVAEAEEYKNILQRIKAEFDNYKKRVLRDNEARIKYANENLIKDLLPIIDSLERSLSASESFENKDESFYKGIKLIYMQLIELLKSYGLKEIDALNKLFDPHYHDAMMIESSENHTEEKVIEVLEKGYLLGDHVIRPVKVKVGKPVNSIKLGDN